MMNSSAMKRCTGVAALFAMLCCISWLRAADDAVDVFDFSTSRQPFNGANKFEFVKDHAEPGKLAAKAQLTAPILCEFAFTPAVKAAEWPKYDRFVIEAFVEGGGAKAAGLVRDKNSKDWATRHDFELLLKPGRNSLTFPIAALSLKDGKGTLNPAALTWFAINYSSEDNARPATIYLTSARLLKGSSGFEVKVLYSFEGNDGGTAPLLEDWPESFKGKSSLSVVEDHATHEKNALKLESHADAGNVQFSGFDGDWSGYDALAIDVFNSAEGLTDVGGWIKDDSKAGYWNRYNWTYTLKPGLSTIKIPIGSMSTPEKGQRLLNSSKIAAFNISVGHKTIFIDNIRLVKGSEEIAVAGMKKFDFGPQKSAVMPGFTPICVSDMYNAARGAGWAAGSRFGKDGFDISEILGRHRPPDDLCRDFVDVIDGTFCIDVPNGTYSVWLMLGPPGNGWRPIFNHRTVYANGKQVVDQKFDAQSFKAHEFAFQDYEDLPDDDLWARYINVLFMPAIFDVEVTNGRLELRFDGHGEPWTAMVNGLVTWPKTQDKDAQRWLANFANLRREQFLAYHVEVPAETPRPYTATEEEQKRGYVRFIHLPDDEIQTSTTPTKEQTAIAAVDLAGTPGEFQDGCFGIYPIKDCGITRFSVTDLTGNGGKIAASAIKLQVTRYKAMNQLVRPSTYSVKPKYIDDIPETGLALKPGVTRSFWVIAHIPENQAPGKYSGQVRVAFDKGQSAEIPLTLEVYPFKLNDPDFPMGTFCDTPLGEYMKMGTDRTEFWNAWADVLRNSKEHGMTSMDPAVSIQLKSLEGGKAVIDFDDVDHWMELARSLGFKQELNGYAVGTIPLKMGYADHDTTAKRFGAASYGELAKAYFDAVREHMTQKNWLPICFCTGDEYLVRKGSVEKMEEHHRILQTNAPGFHFVPFDTVWTLDDASRKMLAQVDTWGASGHTPEMAAAIQKAGRRMWLYNTGMDRFTFGTYMQYARRKYNVSGFFQWIFSGGGTYGHFYLASHCESALGVVYPSTRGLRSTPVWERIRLGANDHRYFDKTFELIQKAKAAGKGQAEAAELDALIEAKFSKINFGKNHIDAAAADGKADNPFKGAELETFRRALAAGICKLEAALK
jgi:hypothetical protein